MLWLHYEMSAALCLHYVLSVVLWLFYDTSAPHRRVSRPHHTPGAPMTKRGVYPLRVRLSRRGKHAHSARRSRNVASVYS
jgi:hypothetical protein